MLDFLSYKNKLSYAANPDLYCEEDLRLFNLFKADAIREAGLEGHPKAHKAFALAWRDGHAEGTRAVFYHLEDLAELLKD